MSLTPEERVRILGEDPSSRLTAQEFYEQYADLPSVFDPLDLHKWLEFAEAYARHCIEQDAENKGKRLWMLLEHDIAFQELRDLLRRAAELLNDTSTYIFVGTTTWTKKRNEWMRDYLDKDAGVEEK